MRISEEYPSKHLKAVDLNGREVMCVMSNVEREKLGDDFKLVLYFKGKEKGVVLNKTNANLLSDVYGDDTADWFDQEIILFSVKVDFNGKITDGIRMRAPTAKDKRAAAAAPQKAPDRPNADMDDDIPF